MPNIKFRLPSGRYSSLGRNNHAPTLAVTVTRSTTVKASVRLRTISRVKPMTPEAKACARGSISGNRLLPGDRANPDSYKVRRAKVGGYRDDFTPEQVAELDALVVATTPPLFGYNAERARRAAQV